jgi:hypothetical protein
MGWSVDEVLACTKCMAKHRDCGYRGTCEPAKHLLFAVKKGGWEAAEGGVVAREEEEGSSTSENGKVFEVVDGGLKDEDLVVACWVMRLCMAEELWWDGN